MIVLLDSPKGPDAEGRPVAALVAERALSGRQRPVIVSYGPGQSDELCERAARAAASKGFTADVVLLWIDGIENKPYRYGYDRLGWGPLHPDDGDWPDCWPGFMELPDEEG